MAVAMESLERVVPRGKVVPVGRPPTSSRRRLFLSCFVALVIFTVFRFSFLERDQEDFFLPEKFVSYLQTDLVDPDYHVRDSDTKFALMNETFLAFAAYDPNEEQERKKITKLLETNEHAFWDSSSRGYRKGFERRVEHYSFMDRPRSRSKSREDTWLWQLQSPRYTASWPKFRQLLQIWSRSKRHDPRVMGELVESVKKPIDEFYMSLNRPLGESVEGNRYKTCAVVGNSGILLNRSHGSFIDSHDMVIRLNNARVKGFENFVGSKTTLSFVNSNVYHTCSQRLKCFCHPYGNVPIIMYLTQSQHLMDVVMCDNKQPAPVIVTNGRFDSLCARLVKWYSVKHYVETTGNSIVKWEKRYNGKDFHYSSGFQAIMLAVGMCEKVNILGFGKLPSAKHHYHTNRKEELDLHDYAAEYRIYDDLIMNRSSIMPFLKEAGIALPEIRIYK